MIMINPFEFWIKYKSIEERLAEKSRKKHLETCAKNRKKRKKRKKKK